MSYGSGYSITSPYTSNACLMGCSPAQIPNSYNMTCTPTVYSTTSYMPQMTYVPSNTSYPGVYAPTMMTNCNTSCNSCCRR